MESDGFLRLENVGVVKGYEGNRELKGVLVVNAKRIGDGAFKNCGKVKEVILQNVAEIGAESFLGCGKLRKVCIVGSCYKMGEKAFSGCGKLDVVVLPKTMKSYPVSAIPKNAKVLVQ